MTDYGAVAAGSDVVADVASAVLSRGGSAVDAVVAGALAATVAEPVLASLAGGGFCLVRTPDGVERLVDFFVAMPGREAGLPREAMDTIVIEFGAATQEFHVGVGSVAVPGFIPGLVHLATRYGSVPLNDLVGPAVAHAETGVTVTPVFAKVLGLVWPILLRSEAGRAALGRADGGPLQAGDRYVASGAADVLSKVGAVWGNLPASMLGGNVTPADLAAYSVIERDPLRVMTDGLTIVTNPPPSFGGALITHGLEVENERRPAGSMRAWADAAAAMVERRGEFGAGVSKGTTHISVVDREGMATALTVSNGSGSGVFVDGGVQLNNMLGEDDLHPGGLETLTPGERIGSMMAPMFVERPGSTVVAGSGGSERIRSALLGVVLRLGRGEPLAESVAAPRVHWDGQLLQVEPGLSAAGLDELVGWGPVNSWAERDFYFGGVHAVERTGVGDAVRFAAVGDTRRGGVGRIARA